MSTSNGTTLSPSARTKRAERALARIGRIDAEVATLTERIDNRLTERRALLAALIQDGESLRGEVAEQVRTVAHADAFAQTGRVLTDDQVREIRRLHATGVSQSALGRRFGISQPSIFKIVRRISYTDVL
jgi:hypothetical protein